MATDLLRITVVAPKDARREAVLPEVEAQAANLATVYGQLRYMGAVESVIVPLEDGGEAKFTAPDGSVIHVFECDAIARA